MNPVTPPAADDENLDQEVAFWDARLRSPLCSDEDRAAFARWRDTDPARARAFATFQGYLETLHDAYRSAPELRAFRDEALSTIHSGRRRYVAVGAAAAAVLLLSVAVSGILELRQQQTGAPAAVATVDAPSSYETAVGERSTILLSDGSRATLDTRSRMQVQFGADQRSVRILSGQALFDVASDSTRPFVVTAGEQRVTAVGTQFAVRLDPDRVSVTLVEGRVRVDEVMPAGATQNPREHALVAGQKLVALRDATGDVTITWTEVEKATSWVDGRIVFEDATLAEAISEINRYSAVPIVVNDTAAGSFRISGMLKTAQPLDFVRSLPTYFPLRLEMTAGQVVLSSQP